LVKAKNTNAKKQNAKYEKLFFQLLGFFNVQHKSIAA
jgi:hypothetical protein